jgi:predicted outer membrane protein
MAHADSAVGSHYHQEIVMRTYLAAVASLGVALGVHAQTVPSSANQPTANAASGTLSPPLSPEEAKLLNQLHTENQIEIAAAKLAAKNTTNTTITEYGALLLRDQTATDRELVSLAKAHGVTLSKPRTDELASLRGLKAGEFDRAFVNTMLRNQQRAIGLVQSSLEGNVQTLDVRRFLERALTLLKMHRDRAEQLQTAQS